LNNKLVEILKEARLKNGLTQGQVAQMLGVKNNTISNYENGKSQPDIDSLVEICKIYNIDYADTIRAAYPDITKKASESQTASEVSVDDLYNSLLNMLLCAGIIKDGEDITDRQMFALEAAGRLVIDAFQKH